MGWTNDDGLPLQFEELEEFVDTWHEWVLEKVGRDVAPDIFSVATGKGMSHLLVDYFMDRWPDYFVDQSQEDALEREILANVRTKDVIYKLY